VRNLPGLPTVKLSIDYAKRLATSAFGSSVAVGPDGRYFMHLDGKNYVRLAQMDMQALRILSVVTDPDCKEYVPQLMTSPTKRRHSKHGRTDSQTLRDSTIFTEPEMQIPAYFPQEERSLVEQRKNE